MMAKTDNFDKLRSVMGSLEKKFPGLMKTGEDIPFIRRVPFGEPALDFSYDGGLPLGRFIEFLGEPHSGKTRNALRIMGRYQRFCLNCATPESLTVVWETVKGMPEVKSMKCSCCDNPKTRVCGIVDVEHTIDIDFMRIMEVDPLGVIYVSPELPSASIGIAETLIRNPGVGCILFDSFGVMAADREMENAIEDEKMNLNPGFLNKAFRKWQAALNGDANEAGEDCKLVIVVNQSYASLSQYAPDVAQGGRGLRHGKALSGKTRIITKMKEKEEVLGVHIGITNEKNKSGMPYRRADYVLFLDSKDPENYCKTNITIQYVEVGILLGVIKQSGAWFNWDSNKWQGKAKIAEEFDSLPKLREEIDAKLYKNNQR